MRHNFGNSPFPLIVRRPSSSNKKRVELATPTTDVAAVPEESVTEIEAGGDQ